MTVSVSSGNGVYMVTRTEPIKFDEIIAECKSIFLAKGKDYTEVFDVREVEKGDRLGNFKVVAGYLGIEPIDVWASYFMKHIFAILSYARTLTEESEPIEQRLNDVINYCVLGRMLIEEMKSSTDG